ncbi:glycerophosphodiester phosphodiesterase family protein [Bacteroides sp.]
MSLCLLLFEGCGHEKSLPKLSGHRGARFIAPENTLASIDSCIKYKIDLAECDVCISKDSVFYLLHDSTLDRTTNGTGDISDWMSGDIDTLDAGSWFGKEFEGIRVPRFADVLRKAKEGGLELTVDFRTGDFRKLVDLIRTEGMLDNCTFVFSSEEKYKMCRAHAPEIKRMQAYIRRIADFERVVNDLQPDIVVIRLDSLTSELVSRCHSMGMEVMALALDSNSPEEDYQQSASLGVDILATDRAEYLRKKYVLK